MGVSRNNAHQCPAYGKNVASVAKIIICYIVYTAFVSNEGDKILKENLDLGLCQRNMSHALRDSDHTKYLVEPQLKEGEGCEWTAKPCKQIVAQRPTD